MAKNLVIVESPAKGKTIKKYLGKDFEVLASYGHVRDLIRKTGAVDPDNDFAMKYEVIEKNAKHVDAIVKALKSADALYLATDPDREGEAISWHLYELIKSKKALAKKPVYRVVFHEITKNAVTQAIKNPRDISMDLVNAQQDRRALDYLFGFTLSPLLWKKIRRGLSAGRVQSPALRLIVEREEEIEKFIAQEYWTILGKCETKKKEPFNARLTQYLGKKVEQFTITDTKQAHKIQKDLLKAADSKLTVISVEKKQRKRQPSPPFTTSTLQQEASRKLGFTAQRTMRTAQQLYENGLITYMRTDAVYLANEAIEEIRALIKTRFGEDYLPEEIRLYKNKSKNAQEAHEAIRPTHVDTTPESLKNLTPEQAKLYELIWKRTVACQMVHALLNTVTVDLDCNKKGIFRANGSTIAHPGFIGVYTEDVDDVVNKDHDKDEGLLPELNEGDVVKLEDIIPEQHFTEPPPRYSEASLVKTLEEFGIGRPSTYASIISTLQNREYVTLEQKRFHPTDVGRIVAKFLKEYFTQYVDYEFTARLEDELDDVARGEKQWIPVLREFWGPFDKLVQTIEATVQRKDVTHESMDEKCPKCSKPLSIRLGKRGRFVGCTGYPECDYTRNMEDEAGASGQPEIVPDRKCPTCESDLVIKRGKYGKFIGCSSYPKCKFIEPLEKPADLGIECAECKQGSMLKRKSRYGKIFYSCSRYPDCKYATWNEPIKKPCPKCNWPILTIKITKRRGTEEACPQKECGYTYQLEAPEGK
jgi:DNA topoisomerase-1